MENGSALGSFFIFGSLRSGADRVTDIHIKMEVFEMNRLNGLNRKLLLCVAAVFVVALVGAALAHTPLFSCWDNGDGTLSCEGGFSDGSSAANMPIRVTNEKDEVIFEGKLDEGGELTFKKPEGVFTVTFDGGPGHMLSVKSSEIK